MRECGRTPRGISRRTSPARSKRRCHQDTVHSRRQISATRASSHRKAGMLSRLPIHRKFLLALLLIVTPSTPCVSLLAADPRPPHRSTSQTDLSLISDMLELLKVFREEGPTLAPLLPRSTILSISGRLRPEGTAIVMRRLSDPDFIAWLRPRRPDLASVLIGLNRAVPLLREIEPEVQLIFSRQSFAAARAAVPEWKLPGVALIFVPRDTQASKRLLLSAYWAAMLQASESARATGRPQLRLERRRLTGGVFYGATFVPPPGLEFRGLVDYNISPAIGFVGNRFILSSSQELALQLVDLAQIEEKVTYERHPGSIRIDLGPVAAGELFCDNLMPTAELLFAERSLPMRAIERRVRSASVLLALLPHATWRIAP